MEENLISGKYKNVVDYNEGRIFNEYHSKFGIGGDKGAAIYPQREMLNLQLQNLYSNQHNDVIDALKWFWENASDISLVLTDENLRYLVDTLNCEVKEVQKWINNLFRRIFGTKKRNNFLISCNIIPIMVDHFYNSYYIDAFSILAHDFAARPHIINQNIFETVLSCLKNDPDELAIEGLATIMDGVLQYELLDDSFIDIINDIFDELIRFLGLCEYETIRQICYAFRDYVESNPHFLLHFIQNDMIEPFFLIKDSEPDQDAGNIILRMCSVIINKSSEGAEYLLKNNVLAYAEEVFLSQIDEDRSLSLDMFRDLLNALPSLVETLIEMDIMQMACDMLNIRGISLCVIHSSLRFVITMLNISSSEQNYSIINTYPNAYIFLASNIMILEENDEEDAIKALSTISQMTNHHSYESIMRNFQGDAEFVDWLDSMRFNHSSTVAAHATFLLKLMKNDE